MASHTGFYPREPAPQYNWSVIIPLAIAASIVAVVVNCITIGNLVLFFRWIRIKFGRRIVPTGKRAVLITGATSGFGLAIAKRLYRKGFTIVAGYYNEHELGYQELLELGLKPYKPDQDQGMKRYERRLNPHLFLVRMDVRSQESIDCSANEIELLLDKHNIELHCLINNAGTASDGPFEFSNSTSIINMVETNLIGVMLVTRRFLPLLILSKGRIINVSSGIARMAGPTLTSYGSTKAAIGYFSESLNQDLKSYGVACHCVIPGNFVTTSNILYTRIRHIQQSIESLGERERAIYKNAIKTYSDYMYHLLQKKLIMSGDDPETVEAIYKIHIPEFDTNEYDRTGWCKRFSHWLVRLFDGSIKSTNLEDSSALKAYEDAVCMRSPPERLYAGNFCYENIAGPLMDFWPPFICSWMYRTFSNELTGK